MNLQSSASDVLSAAEVVSLCREYTMYDWTSQSLATPFAVTHAKGVYFFDADGRRYLDFSSQLMGVNAGHCHPRIVEAIQEQAERLPYVSPFLAHEPRARLGQRLVSILPEDIDKVFFTLGGADANEHAIKIARVVTGRHKILARYRSYHGATGTAIALTGDPRRWPTEPGMSGVVHVLDPYHGMDRDIDTVDAALDRLEETIVLEGPETIAAFILEPIPGTNGVLGPPDGYLEGVRALCDRYGILFVADEVMSGFGRTGEWFAVDHWNVIPDIITMAKGLTSSYVPLGAVGLRNHVAAYFKDKSFPSGLTYNSHPLACAAALATLEVYEEERLIENARLRGREMATYMSEMRAR